MNVAKVAIDRWLLLSLTHDHKNLANGSGDHGLP